MTSRHPVRLVTCAWGQRYIDRLLDFTLASVLAPGNLPALARAFPCSVTVVTEESLFDYVRSHPIAKRVEAVCPLRLVSLDDLVAEPWQYGLTLAYAFFRGFADLGPAMTDTYVLFLNADFIVADGSYEKLIPHMLAGERVLLSPSYCVVEERVRPLLRRWRDSEAGILDIPPRELAQVIIDHRHNTIRAKTANQRLVHFEYMDQFYWVVDERTLLGHQMPISLIAMRPERHVTDLTTFWDWGIVYDFCPSRQLTALGDSDEFLMMEMRTADTYLDLIRLGWNSSPAFTAKLGTYITAYQLDNARFPLTVHASDLPSGVDTARTSLRAFVDEVLGPLRSAPIEHHDHAQWIYHKRYFAEYRAAKATRSEQIVLKTEMAQLEGEYQSAMQRLRDQYEPKLQVLRDAVERLRQQQLIRIGLDPVVAPTNGLGEAWQPREVLQRIARRIFDTYPYARPWHPLHLPYRRLASTLDQAVTRGARILGVCDPESALTRTLAQLPGAHARVSASDLKDGHATALGSGAPRFDLCIIELTVAELGMAANLVRSVLPHMDPNGTLLVHGSNLGLHPRASWERSLIHCLVGQAQGARVHYSGSWATVTAVKLLWFVDRVRGSRRPALRYGLIPLLAGAAVSIAGLALLACIEERWRRGPSRFVPPNCTSVTIESSVMAYPDSGRDGGRFSGGEVDAY